MINEDIKEKLKANWGEKADSENCLAYVKVVGLDAEGNWAAFIYAMNPDDESDIRVALREQYGCGLIHFHLLDLFALHDKEGNFVFIDRDFKPKNIKTFLQSPWGF